MFHTDHSAVVIIGHVMVAFLFVAIAFIALRNNEPDLERPFRVKYGKAVGYGAIVLSVALLSAYLPWSPSALIWPYEWLMILVWSVLGGLLFFAYRAKKPV